MNKIYGDILELTERGHFDVVVHGCNCFHKMGAGLAKQVRLAYPSAYLADKKTAWGDRSKLGKISFTVVPNNKFIIVNAYTQFDWRGSGVKVDYDAVRSCFATIKMKFQGLRIAYPKIGAGLAGGDWSVIRPIINTELSGENHTYVMYYPRFTACM